MAYRASFLSTSDDFFYQSLRARGTFITDAGFFCFCFYAKPRRLKSRGVARSFWVRVEVGGREEVASSGVFFFFFTSATLYHIVPIISFGEDGQTERRMDEWMDAWMPFSLFSSLQHMFLQPPSYALSLAL